MNPNEVTLETLARSWLDAKREEDEARARRQAIAAAIAERLPSDEEEMTERRQVGGNLRIIIARKLNRAVDQRIASEWDTLPDKVKEAFRWKAEVNLKHLRSLEFAAPNDYAIASKYITAKPATPAVEVEEIE